MRVFSRAAALTIAIVACGPTSPKPEGDGVDGSVATDTMDEVCDNGFDDDRDGKIDEDCVCHPGATTACFPGDPSAIGVGSCAAGTQTCSGIGETGTWGPCEGSIGPADELCNAIDDDCNGVVDDI